MPSTTIFLSTDYISNDISLPLFVDRCLYLIYLIYLILYFPSFRFNSLFFFFWVGFHNHHIFWSKDWFLMIYLYNYLLVDAYIYFIQFFIFLLLNLILYFSSFRWVLIIITNLFCYYHATCMYSCFNSFFISFLISSWHELYYSSACSPSDSYQGHSGIYLQ